MEISASFLIYVVLALVAVCGFLITAFSVAVGITVWLVRLEGKNSRNSENITQIMKAVEHHTTNEQIHHNYTAFNEFKQSIDTRFSFMQTKVDGIKESLDNFAGKFERFIEKTLG